MHLIGSFAIVALFTLNPLAAQVPIPQSAASLAVCKSNLSSWRRPTSRRCCTVASQPHWRAPRIATRLLPVCVPPASSPDVSGSDLFNPTP